MIPAILIELFLIFAFIGFASYMRITVILRALDKQLETPPTRKYLNEKLRAYRDWCRKRNTPPYLLITFTIGLFGAVLCWIPIPWFLF